jgi:hypothetical protein
MLSEKTRCTIKYDTRRNKPGHTQIDMLRSRQFYEYATLKWLELLSNKLIATYQYMNSISWTVSMLDTENFKAQSTLL